MTKRMPTIFAGHGSPMIALDNNEITERMKEIGEKIIEYEKPKAILTISAHWYTSKTFIQTNEKPEQIYDMYGFPEELYELKYPVEGYSELSEEVIDILGIGVEVNNDWGIDHGTWTILIHMFPEADIPVVQLSVNANLNAEESYKIGEKLKILRNKGYLIFGSGNIVHNLQMVEWDNPKGSHKTTKFNDEIIEKVKNCKIDDLINYDKLEHWNYAIPTPEHYLPLLYVLGASDDDVLVYNNECNLGSISMTSFAFGLKD